MVKTQLMGILNVTPDSFYDGNKYLLIENAIKRGLLIAEEGADILDIGGESTRPGSAAVSVQEEQSRVIPVIKALKEKVKIPISIDTMKPEIAADALEAGATLLNDVSGFRNPEMREIAASADVDICVMHMLGEPKTMQQNPYYEEGIITVLLDWFDQQVNLLTKAGVKESRIIFDPGIGFGKTVAHNLEIIHNLPKLRAVGFPVLLGTSRKSFMSKILNLPAAELLPTTIAINTLAIQASVDIIRVHDVAEHRKVIDIMDALYADGQ